MPALAKMLATHRLRAIHSASTDFAASRHGHPRRQRSCRSRPPTVVCVRPAVVPGEQHALIGARVIEAVRGAGVAPAVAGLLAARADAVGDGVDGEHGQPVLGEVSRRLERAGGGGAHNTPPARRASVLLLGGSGSSSPSGGPRAARGLCLERERGRAWRGWWETGHVRLWTVTPTIAVIARFDRSHR
jgi:hypothetical protein